VANWDEPSRNEKRCIKKNKKKRLCTLVSLLKGSLSLLLYHLLPKDSDDEKSKRLPRKQIQNNWNYCHRHLSHLLEAMEVVGLVNCPFLPDKSNDKNILKTLLQAASHTCSSLICSSQDLLPKSANTLAIHNLSGGTDNSH
jgi:hypothetical protein